MIPKQILKKAANYKKIDCRPSGCPLYMINSRDDQFIVDSLYHFLFGCGRNNENMLSSCSEKFLSICFEYNKEKTRKLFDRYKEYNGVINNFYLNGNTMPCNLLGEMANFMIKSSTCLDIE